jgi:two-component system OmpR family sensor kinase
MIRNRLYLQIYLTLLASLALVALALSMLAMLGRFDAKGPFEDRVDRFATAMFEPSMGLAERQKLIERLGRGLGADVALFDAKGNFLQGFGNPIRSPEDIGPRFRAWSATLPSGERVVALVHDDLRPRRSHLIFVILLIAGAIGIAAYPVVRYLTRRLDALRTSMEQWGSGDLATRAPVAGRDEVATVARTFNTAANRIQLLIESQKSLLANASHELRSPLARLRMATELYDVTQNDKNKNEIIRNLAELDELVEEILLKSRLGSDQPYMLDQHIDLLAVSAEEAAIAGASVDGSDAFILGNEKLIRRMVRNLVQNAARHGKPPFDLTLTEDGDHVQLRVRDHGQGLRPEDMAIVFDPFFRPAGRSESDGGWGLGLALVAEIARLHDGRAYAEEPEGQGACFVVELPVAKSGANIQAASASGRS